MDNKMMAILLLIVGLLIGFIIGWLVFNGSFCSTGNAKGVLNTTKNINTDEPICICNNGNPPIFGCWTGGQTVCNQCCVSTWGIEGTVIE